ncbi:hypothetical protein [Halomonas cerina]|uniref:Uncharacterized protein n=1 Tax=Halomonas cerina TaxID=447424 RepID=A0A839VFD5_9GAMM|nr:hypothetical protein [Halomonas cerina]MBB3192069.1 hypothetical protein [Halomonas cerina]
MSTKLTDLQNAILAYIHENNDAHNWVPIEPDAFDGRSLHELEKDCRGLESQGLLDVEHPATSLYAITPGGHRREIKNGNDWLLCAITVDGIQAVEAD